MKYLQACLEVAPAVWWDVTFEELDVPTYREVCYVVGKAADDSEAETTTQLLGVYSTVDSALRNNLENFE